MPTRLRDPLHHLEKSSIALSKQDLSTAERDHRDIPDSGRTSCSPSLLISSLGLSDTKFYEPQIKALLGTASHFWEEAFLKLRTVTVAVGLGRHRFVESPAWRSSFVQRNTNSCVLNRYTTLSTSHIAHAFPANLPWASTANQKF